MRGIVYNFSLPNLHYGNTMDTVEVEIVGETSTHYKVMAIGVAGRFDKNIELVKKEDVDIIHV